MPHWYEQGLPFRCKGPECGDCCSGKHGPGFVWLAVDEMERLADHMKLDFHEFIRRFVRVAGRRYSLIEKANNDCIFYEVGKGCTVYDGRPDQCRAYPFWGKVLRTPMTWEQEKAACPGIGEEAIVPVEEIQRLHALQREEPGDGGRKG